MIPFQDLRQTNAPLMDEYIAAAERVLRSGRYINGPEVKAFEEEMAKECGTKFCVGVSTGLDALRLIFRGYMELGSLKEGDEVIIPANTFIATFLAVADCGLVPVAADVKAHTFGLDFSKLPINSKTRAVVPVHLYGNPCWDEQAIMQLRAKGILVIEDNAQAIGARIMAEGKLRPTGSLGDAAAISFYPAKNIGAFGDAGAVLTNDETLATTIRMLANYGSRQKYRHELPGQNCRLDELQAALLRIKIPTISEVTQRRNATARLYDTLISNPQVLKPAIAVNPTVQAWHQYVVRHPRRDQLREYLKDNGIETEIHYPVPCHLQACFSREKPIIKTDPDGLPTAETLANEVLSLPLADISDKMVKEIAGFVNAFEFAS